MEIMIEMIMITKRPIFIIRIRDSLMSNDIEMRTIDGRSQLFAIMGLRSLIAHRKELSPLLDLDTDRTE